MAEIPDWSGKVEAVDSALDDLAACLLDSVFFDGVLGFVVFGEGLDSVFPAEGCSGVSGVGTDDFVFGDGDDNGCASGL